MEKRKIIGLLIMNPESEYQHRVLRGLISQCGNYGFNAAVFSPLVQPQHFLEDDRYGEANIFRLPDYNKLDGVIVCSISISGSTDEHILKQVETELREKCTKPVVILDHPIGNFDLSSTDDRNALREITSHVIDVHGCSDIYCLAGAEGMCVTEERISGFRDAFADHGMELSEDNIFYSDFWYTGGESFAEKIIDGTVHRPQAVVCGNDHMAIGLTNRLIEGGIKVPEQIIVTGYDATSEAAINMPSITSYIPDIAKNVAEAVNMLVRKIAPDMEIIPAERSEENGLRLCGSCGCPENIGYVKERLNACIFNASIHYGTKSVNEQMDIGRLLNTYMFEDLTAASDIKDCFARMAGFVYLIKPCRSFSLCLSQEWLSTDNQQQKGYPPQMRLVMKVTFKDQYSDNYDIVMNDDKGGLFDTSLMYPEMFEESEKSAIYYFCPVHFGKNTFGYAVIKADMDMKRTLSTVDRNWMRNICNILEFNRVQHRLLAFSQRDAMTGLYNRRGMDEWVKRAISKAKPTDSVLIFVIDMDGLKYINDNFGHAEGDFGINAVACAVRRICKNTEICVRAGGDEYYLVGVGEYGFADCIVRAEQFKHAIEEENKAANKPYEISASIGFCCELLSGGSAFENALALADSRMYENKVQRKKQRIN